MELEELINRISFIRTRASLSARKLSLTIGKTAGYIHRLEAARDFAPIFEVFVDILEVCETSIDEFFYYDISAYKQDKQLIELLKGLSPEKKSGLISLLTK